MDTNILGQIGQLPTLSREQLLDLWRKLYGNAAPPGIRREILVPFLAYRIQENAYGGLKPSTRSELRRIARALEKREPSDRPIIRTKVRSGTRMLRQWRGQMHEVVAKESGYEYRGKRYKSLSRIACVITGTRWSGPAFFGLRKTNSLPEKDHD
jgi:hypothetical protein